VGKVDVPVEADGFTSAWQQMRGDDAIQFAPLQAPEREPPPDWLTELMRWLAELFSPVGQGLSSVWPMLKWVLVALAVLGVAWFLFRLFGPGMGFTRSRRSKGAGEAEEWVPEAKAAIALLEEADRLAASGDYDQATHLLLIRSVGQIAEARPDLVEPSSTARELASEARLPQNAREAFGLIAAPVEKSLFALTRLSQDDWLGARAAYAEFALAQKAIRA